MEKPYEFDMKNSFRFWNKQQINVLLYHEWSSDGLLQDKTGRHLTVIYKRNKKKTSQEFEEYQVDWMDSLVRRENVRVGSSEQQPEQTRLASISLIIPGGHWLNLPLTKKIHLRYTQQSQEICKFTYMFIQKSLQIESEPCLLQWRNTA